MSNGGAAPGLPPTVDVVVDAGRNGPADGVIGRLLAFYIADGNGKFSQANRVMPTRSSQDVPHHLPMHVGQAKIPARVAIDEAGVIEAEQMKDRGVQVVDVDRPVDGGVTEVVGGAVNHATFDAASGDPDREAPVIVVTAHGRFAVGHFDGRRPAELAAAEDECFLKSPRCLRSASSAAMA